MRASLFRSEERRLRVIFERAIVFALASAAACDSDKAGGTAVAEAGAPDGPVSFLDAGKDSSGPPDPCNAFVYTPTPADTCGDYVRFPCGVPPGIVPRDDCFFNLADCAQICPDIHYNCHAADGYCNDAGVDGGASVIVPDDAGGIGIDCSICPNGVGRAPAGLVPLDLTSRCGILATYFARASHLEAASVTAFRRLACDLERLGAPASLVTAAEDAARDEIRHTATTARLARRFGARYTKPRIEALPQARSLEEIATENAVEGCIRETFGALVVTWQAKHAADPEIARVIAVIADDETRHGALSWRILQWSWSRLDAAARARITSACDAALSALIADATPIPSDLVARAGLPTRRERTLLARAFAEQLPLLLAA